MMLYIDLNKGKLNTGKLVKKPILVRKQDGKTHIRNQWVDPTTGLAKEEGKQPKMNEAERWSTGREKSTPRNKVKMYPTAHNITINTTNTQRDMNFNNEVPPKEGSSLYSRESSPNLRQKPEKPISSIFNLDSKGKPRPKEFFSNDLANLPGVKWKGESRKTKDYYPMPNIPLSIDFYKTDIPAEEAMFRCGEIGRLDPDEFYEGTPAYKESNIQEFLQDSTDMLKSDKTVGHLNLNAEDYWKNVFKDVTHEGLLSAFSVDGCVSDVSDVMCYYDKTVGTVITEVSVDLMTDDEFEPVGTTSRALWRDEEGYLHVFNSLLDIDPQHQGKGIAQQLNSKTTQLWRHLSGGNPVHLGLCANINVGVYAWANKGYDFATRKDLDTAKKELSGFFSKNGMSMDETLNKCGYSSIDDLDHSWQFASLDDGHKYTLKDKGIEGEYHLGKAFMLGGKSEWGGRLVLNADTVGEKINGGDL